VVRVTRVRGSIPEDYKPAMIGLRRIFCRYIFRSLRMVPGLMADVPAALTRMWADFRRRAGVKTARRAHAAPHRAGGLARNCLRDWHEHDVGVVHVCALLVCATHQRHRGSDFRQAAKLLSIHFARMAYRTLWHGHFYISVRAPAPRTLPTERLRKVNDAVSADALLTAGLGQVQLFPLLQTI
jgi:hypothetical protein